MSRLTRLKSICALVAAGLALHSPSVFACAACYGKSDSPLAAGMNWGIFSLLAVVVSVLSGIASFFIFLARKAAMTPPLDARGELLESTQKA